MATPTPPPWYSASETTLLNNPPSTYAFPGTFRIGTSTIKEPVVRVPQLKGHLALLKAFADLRVQIETLDAATARNLPYIHPDKEQRWAWFVGLAVERFERWCLALTPGSAGESPNQALRVLPLDVIMVLHSYLLNPVWFWEDCSRVPKLAGLGYYAGFLGSLLETPEILTAPPNDSEIRQWVTMTSTPFDYLGSAAVLKTRTIDCPKCSGKVEVALTTAGGTGYLQERFVATCLHCSFASITKESLAVHRMCDDLISKDISSLPGTLFTPAGVDFDRGRSIKELIMLSPTFQWSNGKGSVALGDSEWSLYTAAEVDYSLGRLRDMMASSMGAKGESLLGRIMGAYSDDKLFSIDLRGAVLRQGSFITKMRGLGWTEPQFFDDKEDEVALLHAIARYHAFLDLMASSPESFFVPTLDIDLAWHTHQLTAEHYKAACMNYVGRFINHDDKVETDKLSSAFDITCRAWKNRFNMEYTHCGCHLSGQTIGQKLRHLFNKHTVDVSRLTPPTRDNLLAITRPSDRNAVFGAHYKGSISGKKRWWEKLGRRPTQDVPMGEANPKRAEGDIGHDPAFLVPVPTFFPSSTAPATSRSAPTGNAASGCEGGSSAHTAGASTCGGCGNGGGEGGDCGGGDCGGGGCGGCGGCGG